MPERSAHCIPSFDSSVIHTTNCGLVMEIPLFRPHMGPIIGSPMPAMGPYGLSMGPPGSGMGLLGPAPALGPVQPFGPAPPPGSGMGLLGPAPALRPVPAFGPVQPLEPAPQPFESAPPLEPAPRLGPVQPLGSVPPLGPVPRLGPVPSITLHGLLMNNIKAALLLQGQEMVRTKFVFCGS